MKVYFLSDIHLTDGASAQSQRLEKFLREIPQSGDTVLFGGDVFDLFVGDKEVFRRKFHGVLEGIRSLGERGVRVYYLEGNHDFHLSGIFAGAKGISVEADEFELQVGGAKIWVSHGDLIDPEDTGYRLLRKVTRHGAFQLLLKLLPGAWIDGIGSRSSKESRRYNNPQRGGEVGQKRLRRLYLEFATAKVKAGYDHVLVGHSHLRDLIQIEDSGKRGEYVNLGYSTDMLYYAALDPSLEGGFRFLNYP